MPGGERWEGGGNQRTARGENGVKWGWGGGGSGDWLSGGGAGATKGERRLHSRSLSHR